MRDLAPGLYKLSDLAPGDRFQTGSIRVTAQMIRDFAALTGDATGLHLCEVTAQKAGFAGAVAHGLLVLSLIEGLKTQAPVQLATEVALGWEVTFGAPVLAEKTLSARLTVEGLRRTGEKAMVTLLIEGWTGELVLKAKARYFGHFTK